MENQPNFKFRFLMPLGAENTIILLNVQAKHQFRSSSGQFSLESTSFTLRKCLARTASCKILPNTGTQESIKVFAEGPFENRLSSDSNVIIYHENLLLNC